MTPRSWLFVPGYEERKITKAAGSGSDAIILDLEDGTPPSAKEAARDLVRSVLRDGAVNAHQTWVRIGAVADGNDWRADLEALSDAPMAGLILPKVRSAEDVKLVESLASATRGTASTVLVPIVTEQAEGALAMKQSMTASTRISIAFWGSEDLSADLQATRVKDDTGRMLSVYEVVQGLFLLTCRATGVEPIDTPFLGLRDPEGLKIESERASWMGFAGKQVIHPDHVAVVNQAFTPSTQQIDEAQALVEAFSATGGGALRVDDGMVDPPHLKRARSILERAQRAEEIAV